MADLEDAAGAAGYDIIGFAGRGGSGEVYRSVSKASGQTVALKVLDGDVDQGRLEREGLLLSRIQHPGVARFIETGALGERQFLAMEWLEGKALAAVIMEHSPVSIARTTGIAKQLAAALDEVHRNGVVHRDLSPANIMIGTDDRATIIDFGIGRASDTATITADHSLIGTVRYMAPEIIEGASPTPASDQYSLAIVLYEMLTRKWPFGDGEQIATTLHHQLNTQPVPVSEVTGAPPSGVDHAIERALSKDPTDRFETCEAFVRAIGEPAPTPAARRQVLAALAVAVAIAVALWFGLRGDEATNASVAPATWETGTADALVCNLLTGSGFEDGEIPTNYFIDGDTSVERITLAPGLGIESSQAIQIGVADGFGLYGEIVPIDPNQQYLFSVFARNAGDVAEATMLIEWLDDDWSPLDTASEGADLQSDVLSRTVLEATAPPNAGFAVPRLFKDGSPGVVIADELVFAATGSGCNAILRADA